jgi:hypothetical protein
MTTIVEAPRRAHIYHQNHGWDRHDIVWVTRVDDRSTARIPTGCRAVLEIEGKEFVINDYRQRVESSREYQPGAKIVLYDRVLTLSLDNATEEVSGVHFLYEHGEPRAIPPARFQKIVRRTLALRQER